MDDVHIINITPENITIYGVCGYKDVGKHEELRKKILSSPTCCFDCRRRKYWISPGSLIPVYRLNWHRYHNPV